MPEVLHSIRSLFCTATNATPHEILFSYQWQTPSGHSLPTWLSMPGPILLRHHVRASKYEPLVDKVVLLKVNPQYAHIRFTNGRESTVSVSDLAPARNSLQSGDVVDDNIQKDLNDSTSTNESPKEKELTIHKLSLPQKLYLLQVIQILLPLIGILLLLLPPLLAFFG